MMNLDQQEFQQQQQQQQQQRGILPAQILNALDILVDRLNASSGYSFGGGGGDTSSTGVAATTAAAAGGDGTATSAVLSAASIISEASLPLSNNVADSVVNTAAAAAADAPPQSPINPVQRRAISSPSPPIKALLVGTNEGVGLSRSLGTHESGIFFNSMSEEILSTIETVWATLPSAVPPHLMASVASLSSSSSPNDTTTSSITPEEDANNNNLNHHQPPHSLLSPLQMGSVVKTTTAIYSNCIVMHVHYPPLVVTLLMSPEVNLGAVRNVLFGGVVRLIDDRTVLGIERKKQGILEVLLEPVRRALVRSRCGIMVGSGGATAPGMGLGIGGGSDGVGMIGGMSNTTMDNGMMMTMSLQQQQRQAMTFLQQQQKLQLQSVQNVMPMDPYQQQQMLYQQQMMMAQQHH